VLEFCKLPIFAQKSAKFCQYYIVCKYYIDPGYYLSVKILLSNFYIESLTCPKHTYKHLNSKTGVEHTEAVSWTEIPTWIAGLPDGIFA
jgi:hypothetical protein